MLGICLYTPLLLGTHSLDVPQSVAEAAFSREYVHTLVICYLCTTHLGMDYCYCVFVLCAACNVADVLFMWHSLIIEIATSVLSICALFVNA